MGSAAAARGFGTDGCDAAAALPGFRTDGCDAAATGAEAAAGAVPMLI